MSDVRALLRQQREARRITHTHALYSDTGKLLCAVCSEPVRAESHWEAHLKSASHRQRLASATATTTRASHKRKLDVDQDGVSNNNKTTLQSRGDEGDEVHQEQDEDEEQATRRKRAKPDSPPSSAATTPGPNRERKGSQTPSLTRRQSTTLSQGVEIQIPSRSTPPSLRRDENSSASPSSALTSRAGGSATPTPLPSSRQAASSNITPVPESSQHLTSTAVPTPPSPSSLSGPGQIDESEWAAFEADIAAAASSSAPAPYDSDAVISRPAMTAEQSAAAAKQAQENADGSSASRKAKADADIEDEREEATRALEEEFDEMQELEARVRKLKEYRETLLQRRQMSTALGVDKAGGGEQGDKENQGAQNIQNGGTIRDEDGNDDDDNDDDDDEEDDWDGFRFRRSR